MAHTLSSPPTPLYHLMPPSPLLSLEVTKQPCLSPFLEVCVCLPTLKAAAFYKYFGSISSLKKKKPLRRDASWQIKEAMRSSFRFLLYFPLLQRVGIHPNQNVHCPVIFLGEEKESGYVLRSIRHSHIFLAQTICQMSVFLAECGCFYFNLQISLPWIMTFPWFWY